MYDRILEIVVFLMSHLSEQPEEMGTLDEMSADLRSMGFTDNEISSAYNWLLKHYEDYPESFAAKNKNISYQSVRVLSDNERNVITPEAFGYLLQLRYLGLLKPEQLEMVIDRCVLFAANPVDIGEIKLLASTALFEAGSTDVPFTMWTVDPESEPIN